ncbi:alpha/beta hydrolase [Patescibacteria group bacterium]|nr:alpha/beta hydrolase [Patescibacteria group bacterium]
MEEKVFFNDGSGNRVCGILSNPANNKNNLVVVLVHGFNSKKNSNTNIALIKIFSKQNISSLRIDLFGHGESEGKFEELTLSKAISGIESAINYLKINGYKRIGLVGSSFGGLAAITVAAKSNDLVFLALKCPVSSYSEFTEYTDTDLIYNWRKQGYSYREGKKLNYSFYEDIKNNIAYNVADKIKVPTLIVHGDADKDVPVEQSIKLSRLIPNCRLTIIKGAGHRFSEGDSKEEMLTEIVNFIVKNSQFL